MRTDRQMLVADFRNFANALERTKECTVSHIFKFYVIMYFYLLEGLSLLHLRNPSDTAW